jgi:hypothetical protein
MNYATFLLYRYCRLSFIKVELSDSSLTNSQAASLPTVLYVLYSDSTYCTVDGLPPPPCYVSYCGTVLVL